VQAVRVVQAGQLANALSCAPPLSRRGFGLSALTMLCAVPTAPSRADTPYTQARDIQYRPTLNGYVWCFRFARTIEFWKITKLVSIFICFSYQALFLEKTDAFGPAWEALTQTARPLLA